MGHESILSTVLTFTSFITTAKILLTYIQRLFDCGEVSRCYGMMYVDSLIYYDKRWRSLTRSHVLLFRYTLMGWLGMSTTNFTMCYLILNMIIPSIFIHRYLAYFSCYFEFYLMTSQRLLTDLRSSCFDSQSSHLCKKIIFLHVFFIVAKFRLLIEYELHIQ